MTIRRRLTLCFLAILLLFGLNLVIYFRGNQKRDTAFDHLRNAITRQVLLASVTQSLDNMQKQVALTGTATPETGNALGKLEKADFHDRLNTVARELRTIEGIADPEQRPKVQALEKAVQELSDSWSVFLENFGTNYSKAITESVRADALSQRVLDELLPKLKESEKLRTNMAASDYDRVAALTDRFVILIFIFSAVVSIVLVFLLSRYLTGRLENLKLGALLIGSGSLDYRIPVKTRDELGTLAETYNGMAENLHSARKDLTETNLQLEVRNREVEQQQQVYQSLLQNILPDEIAAELQAKGSVSPKYFEDVTIIFTDFVGFTLSTEKLAAEELVMALHGHFTAFDEIVSRYGLEKLKTIGDSYMCAGGLPTRNPTHPVDAVLAAFEMIHAVEKRNDPRSRMQWSLRIGIHTGPVIAGVVGIQKFAFDVWGDTVNYASRMESSGAKNRINVSSRTYYRIKDFFDCEHRGKVITKDKQSVEMYFVQGIRTGLIDDPTIVPPPAFQRRYQIYFQRDPPWFPMCLLDDEPRDDAPPVGEIDHATTPLV
jgi:class 3 adenylate cyclase